MRERGSVKFTAHIFTRYFNLGCRQRNNTRYYNTNFQHLIFYIFRPVLQHKSDKDSYEHRVLDFIFHWIFGSHGNPISNETVPKSSIHREKKSHSKTIAWYFSFIEFIVKRKSHIFSGICLYRYLNRNINCLVYNTNFF